MLIAALLVVIGLTVGAVAATTRGYRLSGVVVGSLLAVYTLIDFTAFPVFVLSTLLAYVGVTLLAERWLVYSRRLLLASVVIGAVVPLSVFVLIDAWQNRTPTVGELEYLGSILPGVAAYNFYRVDAERRLRELGASLALFAGLFAVGALAAFLWGTAPCTTCALLGRSPAAYTTPLVLTAGSDIAALLGLPTSAAQQGVGSAVTVAFVATLGLALDVPVIWHDERVETPAGVLAAALADGWPVFLAGNVVPEFMQELTAEIERRATDWEHRPSRDEPVTPAGQESPLAVRVVPRDGRRGRGSGDRSLFCGAS